MSLCSLVEITEENWKEVISLEVEETQANLVGPNVRSLAEAYVRQSSVTFAIQNQDLEPVGFMMYLTEDFDGKRHIHRFMIDRRHQKKGYGREALRLTVNQIWEAEGYEDDIMIMFLTYNTYAEHVYTEFGFEDTGEIVVDEKLFRLPYSKRAQYRV